MDHTITGKPLVETPQKVYNVTVENDAGFLTLSFSLDVHYCKEGFYLIRTIKGMFEGSVIVKRGEDILEDSHIEFTSPDVYYCTALGSLSFKMTCNIASQGELCLGMISSTNGMNYIRLSAANDETIEQTTSMIPQTPPSITINQSEIIASLEESFVITFEISEIFHTLDFQPPLPSSLIYNPYSQSIKGCMRNSGYFEYNVMTYNDKGNSSISFMLYIDDCPPHLTLLRLRKPKTHSEGFQLLSFDGHLIYEESLVTEGYKKNLCLPTQEYWIQMTSENGAEWTSPLSLLDIDDTPLENFQMEIQNQVERFVIGDIISFGSLFRYRRSSESTIEWTNKKYNDNNWEEGNAPNWGSFGNATEVHFRHSFTVLHPISYSILKITLQLKAITSVYLNGKCIATFSLLPSDITTTNIWIPTSELQKHNILGIRCLNPSIWEDTPIIMDVRMHIITSQCITPSVDGMAYDNQEQPVPSHGPSLAFDDGYSFWQSNQLPVSLSYYLNDDVFIMPSRMRIGTKDVPPSAFTVVGLQINHATNQTVEDVIATVHNQAFMQGLEREYVQLSPRRAYNAFRIDFTDSLNHTIIQAKAISFTICQQSSCPTFHHNVAMVGTVIQSSCPWNSIGIKQRICSRNNVKPKWVDDLRMCIPKYPPKGIAYIDVFMRLYELRKSSVSNITLTIQDILKNELMILNTQDQLLAPVLKENVQDRVYVDFLLRMVVNRNCSEQMVNDIITNNQTVLQRVSNILNIHISYESEFILRLPMNWSVGIVSLLVIVIAIVVTLICIKHRVNHASTYLLNNSFVY